MPGIVRTRVGYTGGTTVDPTYHRLGDHTETLQVDFDPTVLSYADLLLHFWRSHDPGRPAWSTQYKAAVFVHDAEQERLAWESLNNVSAGTPRPVRTEILPAQRFYLAEQYHQKYYLRGQRELRAEYLEVYPTLDELLGSTAVARVNGYVGGYGTHAQLAAEIEELGLSQRAGSDCCGWRGSARTERSGLWVSNLLLH